MEITNPLKFFSFKDLVNFEREIYILLKLAAAEYGLKISKRSNKSPFKGKEGKTVAMAVGAIKTHITITPCGTFTSEDIITVTLGMALNQGSPTLICRVPDLKFPSCTTYHTCTDTLEYDELVVNNSSLFREFGINS